jgi:hypothetical protein
LTRQIEFEQTIPYYQGQPAVFIRLQGPLGQVEVPALLDSGSQYCLFAGYRAGEIGINLTEGRSIRLSTLAGEFHGYLHPIVIEIEGFRFPVEAVFSLNPIPREILGRHTLFEKITWGLRESQQEIYFSPKP